MSDSTVPDFRDTLGIRASMRNCKPASFEGVERTADLNPLWNTEQAIRDEVVRARMKFPSNEHKLAALTEEVGELAQALLQKQSLDCIIAEAIQVACLAIRIAEEGDSDFPHSVTR